MAKRQRTDDGNNDGGQSKELEESLESAVRSDIWFSDGSVVLQAENTLFKVHKTVLARHSTVFSDIFELPHPDNEPKVEGCPIVILQDRAEDVKHMLLALYDKCYNIDGPIPFSAVAAMIRMGRKYDVVSMRDEGLSRLKKELPSTLSKARSGVLGRTHILYEPRILFKIINLAFECDIQTILPLAYFVCLARESSYPLLTQPEGSYLDSMDPDAVGSVSAKEAEGYLTHATKTHITISRQKLVQRYEKVFDWALGLGTFVGDKRCSNLPDCTRHQRNLIHDLWIPSPRFFYLLDDWRDFQTNLYEYGALSPDLEEEACHNCRREAEAKFELHSFDFWAALPECFGLPQWGDMKDFA